MCRLPWRGTERQWCLSVNLVDSMNKGSLVESMKTNKKQRQSFKFWVSHFISALWQLTTAMWANRNSIVHGNTCQEQAQILLTTLHTQVSDHYRAFHNDNAYLLPHHHYLFTQRSLSACLKHFYVYTKCWLQSVDKARAILKFQLQHLRETLESFSAPFCKSTMMKTSHSTEDTSYSPSEQDDIYFTADNVDTLSLTDFSMTTNDTEIQIAAILY